MDNIIRLDKALKREMVCLEDRFVLRRENFWPAEAESVKWLGFFFKAIFFKNFFGFVINITNVNEKKMKVDNLRLHPV